MKKLFTAKSVVPRKRPEQMAQTRALILSSAAKCFAAKGFERTKLQEIAKEASLTVPTLYNYFESKQNLLESLIVDLLADMGQLFDVLLPRGLNFPQKLELLYAHQFRWTESRKHAFQFLMEIKLPDPDGRGETTRQAHLDRTTAWVSEHADPNELRVSATLTAVMVDAVGNALFKLWLANRAEDGALVKQAPTAADLVLHGSGQGSIADSQQAS